MKKLRRRKEICRRRICPDGGAERGEYPHHVGLVVPSAPCLYRSRGKFRVLDPCGGGRDPSIGELPCLR